MSLTEFLCKFNIELLLIYFVSIIYTEHYKRDSFIFIAEYGRLVKHYSENYKSSIFCPTKIVDKCGNRQQKHILLQIMFIETSFFLIKPTNYVLISFNKWDLFRICTIKLWLYGFQLNHSTIELYNIQP